MRRPSYAAIASTLAVCIAVGGAAWASIPDPSGVIHACRLTSGKKVGLLRVIDTGAGQSCKATETPLSWNQTGPRGASGAPILDRISVTGATISPDAGTVPLDASQAQVTLQPWHYPTGQSWGRMSITLPSACHDADGNSRAPSISVIVLLSGLPVFNSGAGGALGSTIDRNLASNEGTFDAANAAGLFSTTDPIDASVSVVTASNCVRAGETGTMNTLALHIGGRDVG